MHDIDGRWRWNNLIEVEHLSRVDKTRTPSIQLASACTSLVNNGYGWSARSNFLLKCNVRDDGDAPEYVSIYIEKAFRANFERFVRCMID